MNATRFSTFQLVPGTAADGEASAEWLQSIHGELVEAFAEARLMRRVDHLLDLTRTLTMLADAARIDWSDTGRLMGQPREAGRIPVLLKELELKLAAMAALGGPELAAVKRLTGMTHSPSSVDDGVFEAMNEIRSALAAI